MLLIQHPSNYRQSQAMGVAGEWVRGKEVLKERVCWVCMCKCGWLCEPAGWDTCFLDTAPRRVFLLPRLTPSSHYVPWGQATDLGKMPHAACKRAHATWLGSSRAPGKGNRAHRLQSPPAALRCMQAGWATSGPAALPPAPTQVRAVFSM